MLTEYKVIKLLNPKEILIDYGLDKGAKKGDKLRIIERGQEIVDEKNYNYGFLDAVKDIVEVKIPYEHFCLCSKFQKKTHSAIASPLAMLTKSLQKSVGYAVESEEYEVDLDLEESQISNIYLPKITSIKLNDIVQKI